VKRGDQIDRQNIILIEENEVIKIKTFALTLLVTVGLTGCVTTTGGSNQATGTAIGTAAGAALGALIADNSGKNAWVGAMIGGMAGGLIGSAIGAALDEQERQALAAATERALKAKANQKIAWTTPDAAPSKSSKKKTSKSKASTEKTTATKTASTKKQPTTPSKEKATGYVVAGEVYTNSSGQQCRNVQQVANKDGKHLEDKKSFCKSGKSWAAV
jgi:surface antigen